MNIGKRIKQARKKANITQKELGKLVDMSHQQIAQYENNSRNPKFETLNKIAEALNVGVWDLYDELPSEEINERKMELMHHLRFGTDREGRKAGEMLNKYLLLNDTGQDKALEQVELLTKIQEYQKDPETPPDEPPKD